MIFRQETALCQAGNLKISGWHQPGLVSRPKPSGVLWLVESCQAIDQVELRGV